MAEGRARRGADGSVTVAGAGIAGMTAALRLLEAGFDVTVLEAANRVGGKFGAIRVGNVYHEHAYHFLADWCLNFWELAASIGLDRKNFVRRNSIKFLRPRPPDHRPGQYKFHELKHVSMTNNFWRNVNAGVIPPEDMLAYAYSLLDLLTTSDDDPDELEFLNRNSVNGFMRSRRRYMTNLGALLHQEALLKAFAVPSYDTSVRSYRTFLRYFGHDSGGWILKGDCQTVFWDEFLKALRWYDGRRGRARFELRLNAPVERIEAQRVPGQVRVTAVVARGQEPIRPGHLILAIPYDKVAELIEPNALLCTVLPDLLELRKLRSRQMASLDLYFKKPLPGIPPEHVTLIDDANLKRPSSLADDGDIASNYGLSFVDNYQAWKRGRRETWLNVVSADFDELAGLPTTAARGLILEELHRYLDFNDDDIDEERSHFEPNVDARLFANTVGSWQFRPETRTDRPEYEARLVHRRVPNLYLAGDYCRSKIDLVCLEGAVATGIAAARAIAGPVVAEPLVPPDVSRQKCEQGKAALAPWLAIKAKGGTHALISRT
jgi:zeta-carotene desaturase